MHQETNNLFPVFLKLEQMSLLIVGGGKVGLEKLNAVLSNAPATNIHLVAKQISNEIRDLASRYANIKLSERIFLPGDVESVEIVIIAINDHEESAGIRNIARSYGKLVNVADKPDLCDFYLGSIVQRGNLKIAISTNGKSPTMAKRLKEWLNDVLPVQLDETLDNLFKIRSRLKDDFEGKVKRLNELTRNFNS